MVSEAHASTEQSSQYAGKQCQIPASIYFWSLTSNWDDSYDRLKNKTSMSIYPLFCSSKTLSSDRLKKEYVYLTSLFVQVQHYQARKHAVKSLGSQSWCHGYDVTALLLGQVHMGFAMIDNITMILWCHKKKPIPL